MKILFLMPYSPVPPNFGGALRMYNILKNIVKKNEVTTILFGGRSDEANLRKVYPELKEIYIIPEPWERKYKRTAQLFSTFNKHSYFQMCVVNKKMQVQLDRILNATQFDIIHTEFTHLSTYEFKTKAVKIIDAHNVEYDNFKRMWINGHSLLRKMHYFLEYKKLKAEEIEGCKKYDAMFVTSSRDKEIFDKNVENVPKYVIPNGVDSSYFSPCDEIPEPYSIVFTGMMGYVPNYDGMLYFLDEIFPLIQSKIPEARIYIVGNKPPKQLIKRASKNIIVTGYIEDVRPYIRKSTVYIVPLRMGGGTRLKIVEALSMKKPVVTTSIGCEGIDVKSGESAIIADAPVEFADAVIELIKNADLREKIIRNGYKLIQEKYDWSVVCKEIDRIYTELMLGRN